MTDKTTPDSAAAPTKKVSFRKRYDQLERRRLMLIDRLNKLGDHGHRHPASRKALTLLNQTFRKADIVQRVAILEAANWVIGLIEMGSKII